jgi:organic radical activating enzyme
MNIINIAETFFSIQGEGKYAGAPSIFLRLSHCNLDCKNFSYVKGNGNHLGCDSKHLWQQVHSMTIGQLLQQWKNKKWIKCLNKGTHVVLTGGEPLLQQSAIQEFIAMLDDSCDKKVFIEIETNATFKINAFLLNRLNQINASPKLTSSGNPRQKAYNIDALRQLASTNKTIFKFVILKKEDIVEIIHEYIKPLNLSPRKVWLMPEGCTAEALRQKTPMILEWCKKYHMNYCPRMHILLGIK